MKHIVCFHLFNDYSGSPKVLRMVLGGLLKKGCQIDLVTSRGGVLDELRAFPNLKKHSYRYAFSNHAVLTMLRYIVVQFYTFFFAFQYLFDKDCVFYINTLLPVGPALAGRMMGKQVVYHYHENAFAKGAFYKVLAWAMQHLAHEIICVSAYQASFLKRKEGVSVVPNALSQEFVDKLHPNPEEAFKRKNVLMLSSLKGYKGTLEFVELAKRLPQFKFTLIINDTREHVDNYLQEIPKNLAVYARQNDVSRFYNQSSIVLNLSDKNKVVETFGLTALEAMSAGLPVIVPTVGGIAELVEDGVNGYRIDVQELDGIQNCLEAILSNEKAYMVLSRNALAYSKKFSEKVMIEVLSECCVAANLKVK